MKAIFVALLLFTATLFCFSQDFIFEPGKRSTEWWTNAEMQPHYQEVFNDTLAQSGDLAVNPADTTSWYKLTDFGENIFRLCSTVDTLASGIGSGDVTSFHYFFEVILDTAEDDFPMTNRDDTHIVIATADSLQENAPFSYIDKLSVYDGRWIRFIFYCADTCSLRAYLGGHR